MNSPYDAWCHPRSGKINLVALIWNFGTCAAGVNFGNSLLNRSSFCTASTSNGGLSGLYWYTPRKLAISNLEYSYSARTNGRNRAESMS